MRLYLHVLVSQTIAVQPRQVGRIQLRGTQQSPSRTQHLQQGAKIKIARIYRMYTSHRWSISSQRMFSASRSTMRHVNTLKSIIRASRPGRQIFMLMMMTITRPARDAMHGKPQPGSLIYPSDIRHPSDHNISTDELHIPHPAPTSSSSSPYIRRHPPRNNSKAWHTYALSSAPNKRHPTQRF